MPRASASPFSSFTAVHLRPSAVQLALTNQGDALRRTGGPAFARHETFYPRFGWLKKGFDAAAADSEVFLRDDAAVRLGVGKNMARSIRYWCHAFKLLDEVPVAGGRSYASVPSAFGTRLLGPGGWDPFLEDPTSLWLLHWKLLAAPCTATAWQVAFGLLPSAEFSVDGLADALAEYTAVVYPGARTAPSSFRKDAALLARMYGEPAAGAAATEETLQCPFVELGVLRPGAAPRTYAFQLGAKPGLAAAVVVAACLEYAAADGTGSDGENTGGRGTAPGATGARTVAVSRLLRDPSGPGMALKLTEGALCDAVEAVGRAEPRVRLSDAEGFVQLVVDHDAPGALAERLLGQYYAYGTSGGRRLPATASAGDTLAGAA